MLKNAIKKISEQIVSIGSPVDQMLSHFNKCFCFIAANGIQGDILEFGVGSGRSLIILDHLNRNIIRKHSQMECKIFGFDSFQGLPHPQGRDRNIHSGETSHAIPFHQGQFKHTKEEILLKLTKQRADVNNIQLIEGWYDEVLTPSLMERLQIKKASLINIDCDFYESAIVALKWCHPLINQGTIISFDDWFCYEGRSDHGEQHAFQEFLENNPEITATPYSEYDWNGKAFIINR